MTVLALLGLSRIHFYESTNLMTDLSHAGFFQNDINDWIWDSDSSEGPDEVTINLETIDKADGNIDSRIRLPS